MKSHETEFDKFLRNVLGPLLFILTFIFSLDFFLDLWGNDNFYSIGKAVIAAFVITGMEVMLWRIAVLYRNFFSGICAGIISLVSILGSLGAFEAGVIRNTLNSDSYLIAKEQYRQKMETAQKWKEKSKNPKIEAWALVKSEKAQKEASEIANKMSDQVQTGATGEGNGLYYSVASLFDTDVGTAARATNRYISVAFELCLIFLTCFLAFRDRQDIESTATKTQQPKHRVATATNSTPQGAPVRATLHSIDSKLLSTATATEKAIIEHWNDGNRNRSDIGRKVKRSRQYVQKTVKKFNLV